MLSTVRALFIILAVSFATTGSTTALADDSGDAKGIITGQIEAFLRDDGATAYGFASPNIQAMFPSISDFMAMVRGGYAPVYHPQHYQFGAQSTTGDKILQSVDLIAADGTAWIAEYTLARQADGSMKIEGCRLVKLAGVGA